MSSSRNCFSKWPAISVTLWLTGLWLLAQGAFTLVHYLRANPYPRVTAGVRA